MQKCDSCGNACNAGCSSAETFSATEPFYLRWIPVHADREFLVGLSSSDDSFSDTDLDYAIYFGATGNLRVYEDGAWVTSASLGSYAAQDEMMIMVRDPVVTFWRNNVLIYTSARVPIFPLRADFSFCTNNAKVEQFQCFNPRKFEMI